VSPGLLRSDFALPMFPVFVSIVLEYCGKAGLSNILLQFFVSICVTDYWQFGTVLGHGLAILRGYDCQSKSACAAMKNGAFGYYCHYIFFILKI
jgi:hypothetical protein